MAEVTEVAKFVSLFQGFALNCSYADAGGSFSVADTQVRRLGDIIADK